MKFKIRTCRECGGNFVPRSGAHANCDRCRLIVSKRWSREYGKANPRPHEETIRYSSITIKRRNAFAAKANGDAAASFADSIGGQPDLAWKVFFRFPFSYAISKNSRSKISKGGKGIYTSAETRAYMDALVLAVKSALGGTRVVTGKLWIDLFVQKPSHQGDAMNVVDVMSDCIQAATGLNDRWYCLRRLDWEIKKSDPEIFIGLGQEHIDERAMCSGCGIIQPAAEFVANGPKRSIARYCNSCRKPPRILRGGADAGMIEIKVSPVT